MLAAPPVGTRAPRSKTPAHGVRRPAWCATRIGDEHTGRGPSAPGAAPLTPPPPPPPPPPPAPPPRARPLCPRPPLWPARAPIGRNPALPDDLGWGPGLLRPAPEGDLPGLRRFRWRRAVRRGRCRGCCFLLHHRAFSCSPAA